MTNVESKSNFEIRLQTATTPSLKIGLSNPKLNKRPLRVLTFGFLSNFFIRVSSFSVHSLVIASSRLRRTRATSVYSASCLGVAPSGKLGGGSFLPVAISRGLSQPSAMRLRWLSSKFVMSVTSSGVGGRERRQ